RLYRHGTQKTILELPSGTIEASDSCACDAARRELLEETGYGGGTCIELAQHSPNPANHTNLVSSILMTGVEHMSEPADDETERIETLLVSFDECLTLMQRNEFLQAMHVATLFYALTHLKRITF
ncbi:MAG: NUDIX hydrolase, partial [Chitinivibrionales bacterium]|nr:NUDIX hydrolase [Chitinivibrionales bacterium]